VLAAVSEFSALDTSALKKFLQQWKSRNMESSIELQPLHGFLIVCVELDLDTGR
jgi:hypothetical protein